MIWIILELKEYRILSPQVTPAEVPTGGSPGMQTGQGSIKARLDMDGRSSRFWAFFLSITQPTGLACKGSRRCGQHARWAKSRSCFPSYKVSGVEDIITVHKAFPDESMYAQVYFRICERKQVVIL